MNPDRLRMDPKAVQFVKHFFDEGKGIAVICHGPWTLVEAGVVRGASGSTRRLSWTAELCRREGRMTFLHSIARCSRNSPKASTAAGADVSWPARTPRNARIPFPPVRV